ncbi:MAG: hypothetical protein IKZ45_03430 [Fibrobacter sp.]|nr:hypothetical protein [Fibrobacter sp.]
MNSFKNSLYAFEMLCLGAASLAYGVELNAAQVSINDTVKFGAHRIFAGFGYEHVNGKWNDGWSLTFNREDFLGFAGFNSDFRNISLSVTASSAPAITSQLTAHTVDSSFFAGTTFGRGNPFLMTVRWESENDSDQVHLIEADWETDYIRKGFVIGGNFKRNHLQTGYEQIRTTPVKPDKEYFIKDSSQINIWDTRYRHSFEKTALDVQYTQSFAKSEIIGNSYRESSTKRFMYLPVKGFIHYANTHWGNESYGLDAKGILAYGKMEKNNDRFFETLAPNRLLPASVTQALSFSFLQRNYLIDADLDIAAATFGGYFNPHFNISGQTRIAPKFGLYGYYTYDELEIEKTSKTTSFIGFNADTEWWLMSLESTGLIANAGISLGRPFRNNSFGFSLEWGATQIIPLKTDIRKKWESETSEESSKTKPEGSNPSGIFKNGFATQLITTLRF